MKSVATWLVIAAVACTALTGCSEPAEPTVAPDYNDQDLNDLSKDSRHILGRRLGWFAIGGVEGDRQVVRIGAVDMSDRDRTNLEDAAPHWVEVDAFETKYSLRELNRFSDRALAAIQEVGLEHFFNASEVEPDRVLVYVNEDRPDIRHVLNEALPDDAYAIHVGGGGLAL